MLGRTPSSVARFLITFGPMASPWRRGVATLMGLWFAVSVSGVALQFCARHGGSHAMGDMGQMGMNCDHAGPAGSVPSTHTHPSSQHHPCPTDDCSCLGMCCITAAVTLTPSPLVAVAVVEAEAPILAPPPGAETVAPHAAPDVTLPPPLGPPTLRA